MGVSAVVSGIRPGMIIPTAHGNVEPGFLACDGSAVSRTVYAALFLAIGTTWGVGDGATTFNLPPSGARGLIGAGQDSGLTLRTVGQKGGEETHVQTAAEMAAHTHGGTLYNPGGTANPVVSMADAVGGTNGTYTTSNAGSGAAQNNMAPYVVALYQIKY